MTSGISPSHGSRGVKDHAGCIPKKLQLKHISSVEAKLRISQILTRSQNYSKVWTSSLCAEPGVNEKPVKAKQRKLDIKESKLLQVEDDNVTLTSKFLRQKQQRVIISVATQPQCDDSSKSFSVETVQVDLGESQVSRLFDPTRSCLKVRVLVQFAILY